MHTHVSPEDIILSDKSCSPKNVTNKLDRDQQKTHHPGERERIVVLTENLRVKQPQARVKHQQSESGMTARCDTHDPRQQSTRRHFESFNRDGAQLSQKRPRVSIGARSF